MFKWKDSDGKYTPFARAARTFVQCFIPAFVTLAGFSAASATGVVDISLVVKGSIAGVSAGVAGVLAFVMNFTGTESD